MEHPSLLHNSDEGMTHRAKYTVFWPDIEHVLPFPSELGGIVFCLFLEPGVRVRIADDITGDGRIHRGTEPRRFPTTDHLHIAIDEIMRLEHATILILPKSWREDLESLMCVHRRDDARKGTHLAVDELSSASTIIDRASTRATTDIERPFCVTEVALHIDEKQCHPLTIGRRCFDSRLFAVIGSHFREDSQVRVIGPLASIRRVVELWIHKTNLPFM
jgi:hypothetical protein